MLDLRHFTHLPEMVDALERVATGEPGLILVTGFDPRPALGASGPDLLPGGRAAFFRILVRRLMPESLIGRVLIFGDSHGVRVPRERRKQIVFLKPDTYRTPADLIAGAASVHPALLVAERLDATTLPAALEAGRAGVRVVAQWDTVFRGAEVLRALVEDGFRPETLVGVRGVIAAQRLPALCPVCRRELTEGDDPTLFAALMAAVGPFFIAPGCPACGGTGRQGDVAAFDVYYQHPDGRGEAVLPLSQYLLGLAREGHIDAHDLLDVEGAQQRRTYRMLAASERALNDANLALNRKLIELEAAQRVLQQRNRALVSLEDVSRALLSPMKLSDLTALIARNACDLGGADRAILYCLCDPDSLDVMSSCGWDPDRLPSCVDPAEVFDPDAAADPTARPYYQWPPGIVDRGRDIEGVELRAGLWVPLVAQGENVGLMVVHSTRRKAFEVSEMAMLEAFAGHAALAVQRTRMVEELEGKIAELEAAQAELRVKERMEAELALAREVQQSLLPRTFPLLPGFRFAAHNEPARQVGGDFYDVFVLDEDRFGLVVADVSDKGMPAALYMALSRSLLLAEARREASPALVLAQVNRLLRELAEPDMFVSMFYGVVDVATRRMRYARAGHDRPILLRAGQSVELGGRGALLGVFDPDELLLTEEELALRPGDRLTLFTDGLTDAFSPADELFGGDRLAGLLSAHAGEEPDAFIQTVFAAIHDHRAEAEQYDDMTLLVADVME